MDKPSIRLQEIFSRYMDKTATEEEKNELWDYINDPIFETQIRELIAQDYERLHNDTGMDEIQKSAVLQNVFGKETQVKTKTIKLWSRICIAAAVALIVFGVYFFNYQAPKHGAAITSISASNILPGKNTATLTLSNGKKIKLSSMANGELANEAGVSIKKTADGQLIYEIGPGRSATASSQKNSFNTLSTDKGETYNLHLPDGSLVVLNAVSSLTYSPGLFNKGTRTIKLSGEGYFQVAKDKSHPFIVESNGQEVKVLGTHFNINSYEDEPITKTTLLEGSVVINNNTFLKPGEQAILTGKTLKVSKVDVAEAVAWKNGYFKFNDENIESIMRKISRWYNVEVLFKGSIPNDQYNGRISRSKNIDQVLDMLSTTNTVQFKVEGRRITVTK